MMIYSFDQFIAWW